MRKAAAVLAIVGGLIYGIPIPAVFTLTGGPTRPLPAMLFLGGLLLFAVFCIVVGLVMLLRPITPLRLRVAGGLMLLSSLAPIIIPLISVLLMYIIGYEG